MKELINVIVQKTGISEENAQKSVQVTLGFLKAKLPAPIAAQLDSFLSANPVLVGAEDCASDAWFLEKQIACSSRGAVGVIP
jgi:hypothetical protein